MTNEKAAFLIRVLNAQKKMVLGMDPQEQGAMLANLEEALSIIKFELYSNDRRASKRKR